MKYLESLSLKRPCPFNLSWKFPVSGLGSRLFISSLMASTALTPASAISTNLEIDFAVEKAALPSRRNREFFHGGLCRATINHGEFEKKSTQLTRLGREADCLSLFFWPTGGGSTEGLTGKSR